MQANSFGVEEPYPSSEREENKKNRHLLLTPSLRSRAVAGKKFTKNCDARAKLLFSVAPFTRIRIFLTLQLFLSGFGCRPHVAGESAIRIRNFLNPLSRVEMFEYATNPQSCER